MSKLAEKVERHWFLILVATFGAGAGAAAALYEQVLLPKVHLDAAIERKLTDAKAAELHRETQALLDRYPRELQEALDLCTSELSSARFTHELLQAEARLEDGSPPEAAQRELSAARAKLEKLKNELASHRARDRYGRILRAGSPYPVRHASVPIGTRISEARTKLAVYSPNLTDSWLNVSFPSGPFDRATLHHDQSGGDPEIEFIVFWFRDQFARDLTLEQALCAFGAGAAVEEADGHIVRFLNVGGCNLEINDSGYKIVRAQ